MELWVLGTALGPLLIAGVFVYTLPGLPADRIVFQLAAMGVILVGGIAIGGTLLFRRLNRMRDDRLGYLGERAVGEYLEPLKPDGYRVFHDVPASNGKKRFNLDHVVVGPTGVALVETKARRKRRARPGYKEYEASFDGRKVIFPWGEDTQGIKQAKAQADWLSNWITTRTGLKTPVRPILTFPGWFVKESPSPGIRVINPKILPQAVKGRGQQILSAQEIDLIARQLDSICRDVED
ncbi:MAG: nuclease-related domain-containing protein [Opitutaceae bacterium]